MEGVWELRVPIPRLEVAVRVLYRGGNRESQFVVGIVIEVVCYESRVVMGMVYVHYGKGGQ